MKILLCHPGHGFSTSDVFDGLSAGFTACGVEVVPFTWDRILQTLGSIVVGAMAGGMIRADQGERAQQFATWLASADALSVAVDQEVDAAFVVNGTLFPPSRALTLAKLGIPVACYGTESPYFDDIERQMAPLYSHWFTQERTSVAGFQSVTNGRAFYLPMAYNPETHQPGPADPDKACDAVFIGGGYPERKALLNGVDWTGIHRETHGTLWHLNLDAERGATDLGRAARYAEGAIPNTETTAWHRSATVALNIHRQMTYLERAAPVAQGAESLGPRAYEIPAVGGFMLCDDERRELFDVYGEAAASFRAWDSASLERELRYWLAHPDAREQCRRAQLEAVTPHTWTARAATVLETIFA